MSRRETTGGLSSSLIPTWTPSSTAWPPLPGAIPKLSSEIKAFPEVAHHIYPDTTYHSVCSTRLGIVHIMTSCFHIFHRSSQGQFSSYVDRPQRELIFSASRICDSRHGFWMSDFSKAQRYGSLNLIFPATKYIGLLVYIAFPCSSFLFHFLCWYLFIYASIFDPRHLAKFFLYTRVHTCIWHSVPFFFFFPGFIYCVSNTI